MAGCLLLLGCRSSTPLADPFGPYGTRIVPPPATGSIGTASGYALPPPAAGSAATSSLGNPNGLLAPPLSYVPAASQDGNWRPSANFAATAPASATPIVPSSSFAMADNRSVQSSLTSDVRSSDNLAWRSPSFAQTIPPNNLMPSPVTTWPTSDPYTSATTIQPTVATGPAYPAYAHPPTVVAPVATYPVDPYGQVLGASTPAYSSPVRPSIVRPAGYEAGYLDPVAIESGACCEPIVNQGGALVPMPYASAPMTTSPTVAPATYTTRADDAWHQRLKR